MQFLAEHADQIYFGLALGALACVGVWWVQRQVVYLAGAAALGLVLLGAWLVLRTVPTQADQVETALTTLAQAVRDDKRDEALSRVIDDFHYRRKSAEKWYDHLRELMAEFQVDGVTVSGFELKSMTGKEAKVGFMLAASSKGQPLYSAKCSGVLRREGEAWKLATIRMYKDEE